MSSLQQVPEKGQQVPAPVLIDGVSEQQIDEAVKAHVKEKRAQQRLLNFTAEAKDDSSFRFDQTDIRVVTIKGEPWFVAADVCKALGLTNSREAMRNLDDSEKGVSSTDTLGGPQKLGVVSESGLYTLVLRCRDAVKPGTVSYRFRKWVTSEVLPSIRKNGGYATEQKLQRAYLLATEAASGVARTVFNTIMDGGNFEIDSWMLTFGTNYDGSPRPYASLFERGTLHFSVKDLIEALKEGGELGAQFTNEQLAEIVEGCGARLKSRIAFERKRKEYAAEVA